VTRLNDGQYWLYAAADPKTNDLHHTRLEPTTNNALADRFSLISMANMTLMTQQFS
jgi:transposase-like protein